MDERDAYMAGLCPLCKHDEDVHLVTTQGTFLLCPPLVAPRRGEGVYVDRVSAGAAR